MYEAGEIDALVDEKFPWKTYKEKLGKILDDCISDSNFCDFVSAEFSPEIFVDYELYVEEKIALSSVKQWFDQDDPSNTTSVFLYKFRLVFCNAACYWIRVPAVRNLAYSGLDFIDNHIRDALPELMDIYTDGGMNSEQLEECRDVVEKIFQLDPKAVHKVFTSGTHNGFRVIRKLFLRTTYKNPDTFFSDLRHELEQACSQKNLAKYAKQMVGLLRRGIDKSAILNQMIELDTEGVFLNPVLESFPEIKDSYEAVIKHPMDFRTIREKLDGGKYTDDSMFTKDMKLVFQNCIQFNKDLNPLYAVYAKNQMKAFHSLMGGDANNSNQNSTNTQSKKVSNAVDKSKAPFPEFQSCLDILEKLMMEPFSKETFNAPFDWKAAGLPQYPEIVKQPMDFLTIKQKLEQGLYASKEDFDQDVRLVFSNCLLFNRDSKYYTDPCKKLRSRYNKVWTKLSGDVTKAPEGAVPFPKRACKDALEKFKALPASRIYLEPVKKSQYPDYYTVVKNPMDIKTMMKKIKNDAYATKEDFVADVRLMLGNSRLYNAGDESIVRESKELETSFEGLLADEMAAQSELKIKLEKKPVIASTELKPKAPVARVVEPAANRSATTIKISAGSVAVKKEVFDDKRSVTSEPPPPPPGPPPLHAKMSSIPKVTPPIVRDPVAAANNQKSINPGKAPSVGALKRRQSAPDDSKKTAFATITRKNLQPWESFAAVILRRLIGTQWGRDFFGKSVFENFPDEDFRVHYLKRIETPMDLGTIIRQLDDGDVYKNFDEVIADINLMFNNAFSYNDDPGSEEIRKKFQNLRNYFDNLLYERPGCDEKVKMAKREERMRELGNDGVGVTTKFNSILRKLTNQQNKKNFIDFMQPVNADLVPGYRDIIKEPMDLMTIKTKLDKGDYSKSGGILMFCKDFRLIVSNCLKFNIDVPANQVIRQKAQELSDVFEEEFGLTTCDAIQAKEFNLMEGREMAPIPKKRKVEQGAGDLYSKPLYSGSYGDDYAEDEFMSEEELDDTYNPTRRTPPLETMVRKSLPHAPKMHHRKPLVMEFPEAGYASKRFYEIGRDALEKMEEKQRIARKRAFARIRKLQAIDAENTEQALRRQEREAAELKSRNESDKVSPESFEHISLRLLPRAMKSSMEDTEVDSDVTDMDTGSMEPPPYFEALRDALNHRETNTNIIRRKSVNDTTISYGAPIPPKLLGMEEAPKPSSPLARTQSKGRQAKRGKGKIIQKLMFKKTLFVRIHQRVHGNLCFGNIIVTRSTPEEDVARGGNSIEPKGVYRSATLAGFTELFALDLDENDPEYLKVLLKFQTKKSIGRDIHDIFDERKSDGALSWVSASSLFCRSFVNQYSLPNSERLETPQDMEWRIAENCAAMYSPWRSYQHGSRSHASMDYVCTPGHVSVSVQDRKLLEF